MQARLAFRHSRLLATWIVAATALAACMPTAELALPSPSAPIAAAPTATRTPPTQPATPTPVPAPSRELDPSKQPGPSGDAVTGGEPGGMEAAGTVEVPATPPAVAAPAADPDPFAMNLYRRGDFVAQYTFDWCVGASLQMALNLATSTSHTTRADQERLWEMARDRSFSPFGGANPRGWTAVLNEVGIGPYELVSVPTLDAALTTAAEALRATKRPVGLVMWRGRHAWVMSGFEATADPRATDEFEVTGVRVLDPLYPHGSSTWGRSPKPNSLVTPATLAKQFVVRDVTRSRVNLGVPTGYLLILPVAAAS